MKITTDNDILQILKTIYVINSFLMDKFYNDNDYDYHFDNVEYQEMHDTLLELKNKIIDSQ